MGNLRIPVGLDISDADAGVSDVKDPKTFYAGAEPKKTGTMPTVAIVAGSGAYPQGYHAGNGSGLVAIDADLVVSKIKKDVVIFGVTGTFENTLAEDIVGSDVSAIVSDNSYSGWQELIVTSAQSDSAVIATKTQSYAATSLAVAVGFISGKLWTAGNDFKLRLYMDGVQVAESAYLPDPTITTIVTGTRALSGSKICKINLHNYNVSSRSYNVVVHASGEPIPAGIGIGSVKLV